MTPPLLLVSACRKAWWADGTHYSISLNYVVASYVSFTQQLNIYYLSSLNNNCYENLH